MDVAISAAVAALFIIAPIEVTGDLLDAKNSSSFCFDNTTVGIELDCVQGHVIAINSSTIAVKPSSKNCSRDSWERRFTECCQTNDTDDCIITRYIEATDNYIDQCNGKAACHDLEFGHFETYHHCNGFIYDQMPFYLQLDYYCIAESAIFSYRDPNLVSSPGGTVYLQSPGFPDGIPGNTECRCSVQTDAFDSNITVYIIQLRLHNSSSCAQSLTVDGGQDIVVWTAGDNTAGVQERTAPATNFTIDLKNNCTDVRGNFWFGFQDSANSGNISISCAVKDQTSPMLTNQADVNDSDERIDGKIVAIGVLAGLLAVLLTTIAVFAVCRRNTVDVADEDDIDDVKRINSAVNIEAEETCTTLTTDRKNETTITPIDSIETAKKTEHVIITEDLSSGKKQKAKKIKSQDTHKGAYCSMKGYNKYQYQKKKSIKEVDNCSRSTNIKNKSQCLVDSREETYVPQKQGSNKPQTDLTRDQPLRRSPRNVSPWSYDLEPFADTKRMTPREVGSKKSLKPRQATPKDDTVSRASASSLSKKGRHTNLLPREPDKHRVSKHKIKSKSVTFFVPQRSVSPVNYINQPLFITMPKTQPSKNVAIKRPSANSREIFKGKQKDDIIESTNTDVSTNPEIKVSFLKTLVSSAKPKEKPDETKESHKVVALSREWHNPEQITDAVHLDSIRIKTPSKRKTQKKKKTKFSRKAPARPLRRYSEFEILPILSKWETALGRRRLEYPKENMLFERNTANKEKKRKKKRLLTKSNKYKHACLDTPNDN